MFQFLAAMLVNIKFICIGIVILISSAHAEEIKITSPKNPIIFINDKLIPWNIIVSFKPVKSSSNGRNDKINRVLAEMFLKKAILKKVNLGPKEAIVLKEVELVKTEECNNTYTAQFTVAPVEKKIVEELKYNENLKSQFDNYNTCDTMASKANEALFSRKSDLENSIETLTNTFKKQFPSFPELNASQQANDHFFFEIGELEQMIVDEFTDLKKEIEMDKYLLEIERKDILASIAFKEKHLLKELSEYAQSSE
jgi:hypothetical protein